MNFLRFLQLTGAVLLWLGLHRPLSAQTVTVGPDSARVATPTVSDSLRRTERLFGKRVTRPQKAALLALMLPGAGQIYNHRYWKLPLVYGAIGGTGYGLYFYQKAFKEYKQGKAELANLPAGTSPSILSGPRVRLETSAANVEAGLVGYRRYRDTFIAYTAVAYGITILDALVDAHLRDFDISDDLALRLEPALLPTATPLPGTGLALTLHLK
ncbi:hypothetical protein K3G63_21175 [Hymenobacter sp. HSC-4F20]|uniref:DUF5683 domain-containing protein n=1 Tax=Hymenobacter sp. HSC-4F20 TaxID=2864135 RepID=UPI001C73B512|nr:DUF5683 domain-containing protein [Hymenobacter sp. HSC-4F20]MBX0292969.1 hypothetical protein [Hymenobacter sp. HSC-4F20]